MRQPDLFNQPIAPHFDGWTYDPSKDHKRLNTAMGRVFDLMRDGAERTLSEIATRCRCSEAGASARLRDLRKDKWRAIYGTWIVRSRRIADGLWYYSIRYENKRQRP